MELMSRSMESSVDPPAKNQLDERSAFLRSIRSMGLHQSVCRNRATVPVACGDRPVYGSHGFLSRFVKLGTIDAATSRGAQ